MNKIFVWNCWGVNNQNFKRCFGNYIYLYKPCLATFFEMKTSTKKVESLFRRFDYHNFYCIDSLDFGKGIWVAWHCNFGVVDVIKKDKQYLHLKIS